MKPILLFSRSRIIMNYFVSVWQHLPNSLALRQELNSYMNDVLGQAILDYYEGNRTYKLWINNTYGRKEEMPVSVYFRTEQEMPALEGWALKECKGKVLDIGAGAGAHTLALQNKGMDVTALELSPKAAEVITKRGVAKIIQQDIFDHAEGGYDTLLLLMNGIGITGSITGLRKFLKQSKSLLSAKGQLVFDSSDVAYLYNGKIPRLENYYGEIKFQYQYKKEKSDWFTWLYIDKKLMRKIASEEGWDMQLLFEDELEQYLVRLTPTK